ncbi:MAG: YcgN family cysteine cluster protein [Halieaceae bacterium]|nr:YcgN family cysteine cluster protein [Halieaceae bacterium]
MLFESILWNMMDLEQLSPGFWRDKPMSQLSDAEWEALCDGCGKCCLHKLQDEDSGEVYYTRVACQLLDRKSGRCTDYANRKTRVNDCIDLREMKPEEFAWMPATCAYRLVFEGKDLPDWHWLKSGRPGLVHKATSSVRGRTVSESEVDLDHLEDEIIHWIDC